MACHAAMTDKLVTILETEEVEKALKALKKGKVTAAPVVNKEGALVGVFCLNQVFRNLLPLSVSVPGSNNVDILLDSAPGIAKRLRKTKPLKVSDLLKREVNVVYPETPTWEGLKELLNHGSPLVVIEKESKKPLGVITEQSILDEFERMQD